MIYIISRDLFNRLESFGLEVKQALKCITATFKTVKSAALIIYRIEIYFLIQFFTFESNVLI